MGCGKIVCVQEGSGPCFFCGNLVCTKDEKEILDRGSRKSAELYSHLMGLKKGGNTNESSLSAIGAEFQKATHFRNKLLAADADSKRTRQIIQRKFGIEEIKAETARRKKRSTISMLLMSPLAKGC
ncbi:hypothetical protein COOONC_09291, partial [Cooperia oncophora]